jgi:hypothetical protein
LRFFIWLFDALVEHVAEAARHRDLDARVAFLEALGHGLEDRGRPACVQHERLLGFRLLVNLVKAFGLDRRRHGDRSEKNEQCRNALRNHNPHDSPPTTIMPASCWNTAKL